MKKISSVWLSVLFLIACTTQKNTTTAVARNYETIYNGKEKILKGLLQRSDIEDDTTFAWFKQNYGLGMANATAVEAFRKNGSKFQMVVFGGTWSEDTQNLLPQFYRLADKSGYPAASISLIGVDRSKTTLDNLNTAFHITNVPTFIVMKDGKEVGRVVEYGKYGKIDKELGEIVAGMK